MYQEDERLTSVRTCQAISTMARVNCIDGFCQNSASGHVVLHSGRHAGRSQGRNPRQKKGTKERDYQSTWTIEPSSQGAAQTSLIYLLPKQSHFAEVQQLIAELPVPASTPYCRLLISVSPPRRMHGLRSPCCQMAGLVAARVPRW